jgi:fatty-acyl-CoA synthase
MDDSAVESADVALDDPHLLLHTGGSTGTPKATIITHGSIAWNSLNTIASWGLRPDDVTPMVFPTFHTGGWNVITIPLFHQGGTIVIDREVEPGRVLEQIESEGATLVVAVPAVLRMMADHEDWAETDLASLRFVKSGGGPCRESVIRAWRERDGPTPADDGVDLSQGYGLTECGPNNFAMPDSWADEKVASVGKPAMHVDARIVDDLGRPLPDGEIGELELAGQHAAAGYWRNPEETEAAFGAAADTPDGTEEQPRRWVSTGDLARVDDDGFYYIEGRKKNMFVSGGENVYPPAVEDAIAEHPDVGDVVVIGIPDETWGTVGKAVVQPAGGAGGEPFDLGELEAFLEDRLARFEVPKALAFVEELPMSGPSKIDRQAVEDEFGE